MSIHAREHEERLAALLAGEQGAEEAVPAQLADCPVCRERWGALRSVAGRVGAAAADQRALLGELACQGHEPVDLGAMLQRVAAREPHPRPRRHRAMTRVWMSAAAAAVLVCLGAWLGARFLAGGPAPTWLGQGRVELIAPRDEVRSFERFEWAFAGEAANYTLRVYDGTGGERGEQLHEVEQWHGTIWEPSQEIRAQLGRSIVWEVVALDEQQSPVDSASAFASLSR